MANKVEGGARSYTRKEKAAVAAGLVGGGAVAAVSAPAVATAAVGAVGFTATGVAAGSAAAAMQSTIGAVGAGSAFAAAQSIGATGSLAYLGVAGTAGVVGIIAVAGALVVAGAVVGGVAISRRVKSSLEEEADRCYPRLLALLERLSGDPSLAEASRNELEMLIRSLKRKKEYEFIEAILIDSFGWDEPLIGLGSFHDKKWKTLDFKLLHKTLKTSL